MSDLRESLSPGDLGHIADHEALHLAANGLAVVADIAADGVTNDTAGILDAIDEAPFGGVVVIPPSAAGIVVDALTIDKCVTFMGAGPFATRFVPSSDYADPVITFAVTQDSTEGIYGNYRPALLGIGIDRSIHDGGPCLRTEAPTAWLLIRDFLASGGTRSIEHHAPNSTIADSFLWDASDACIDMDEAGLELRLYNLTLAAQVTALNTYIRLTIASGGGLKGAIYAWDVACNAVAAVTNGVVITAPSLTEVPMFWNNLIIDNVVGGGPCMDIKDIQTLNVTNGWMNGTNGNVRMDGCVNPRFRDLRLRGGTHTFEFVNDTTQGFTSECEVFTGPAYKVAASNKPTLIDVNDDVAGATDIGQVTNDAAWFMAENTHRRRWSSLRLQGMLRQREAGTAPPQGFGNMVSGVLTVTHPSITANTRFEFWRGTTGSAPGELHHDVLDNIAGTSAKIKSTSLTDNGRVHWRILGDAD